MFVLDLNGNQLFEGSRHDCKQFVRKNRVLRYRFTDHAPNVPEPEIDVDLTDFFDDE